LGSSPGFQTPGYVLLFNYVLKNIIKNKYIIQAIHNGAEYITGRVSSFQEGNASLKKNNFLNYQFQKIKLSMFKFGI